MAKSIKIDYPDKHWDYTDSDSVHNHLVFIKKLENTKWNHLDDQVNDYEKCWAWEINRSLFFEEPEYFKELEDARKLCREHEKRLVKLILDNPGEEDITQKHEALEQEFRGKNKSFFIDACRYYFPFNVPEWEHSAYLSHSKTKRSKWKMFQGYMPSNIPRDKNIFINNLYISSDLQNWSNDAQSNIKKPNDLQLNKVREWNGIPLEFPPNYKTSSSVPMVMHIDTLSTRDEFLEAIRKQWKEIKEERKKLVAHYESLGAKFISKKNKGIILKQISSALRQLGHYRLLKHCELDDWKYVKKIMPKGWAFATQRSFLTSIKSSSSAIFFRLLDSPTITEDSFSFLDAIYRDE